MCCWLCAAQDTQATGHSGILESAKAVLEDLQSTGILEGLLLNAPVSSNFMSNFISNFIMRSA